MIALDSPRPQESLAPAPSPARLLAPTLPPRGSVAPGDRVPVDFPLRALHGTNGLDVVVRFGSEAARCEPEEINLGPLAPGANVRAATTAIVSPLNGKSCVRVWADITVGETTLRSEDASLPIEARSRLAMHAVDHGETTTVTIANDGAAPAVATLEVYGGQEITCERLTLETQRRGLHRSSAFTVVPQSSEEIVLHATAIDHLIVTALDGERASTSPARDLQRALSALQATLETDAPPSGVRRDDLVNAAVTLRNTGGEPIDDLAIALRGDPGSDLLRESISLDDTRLIGTDLRAGDAGEAVLRVGRLGVGARAHVRCSFRIVLADPREVDTLRLFARIDAGEVAPTELQATVAVDHRPAFAPTTTYLGSIEEDGEAYAVETVVTNAEARRLERLRVRFDLVDAVADETVTITHGRQTHQAPLRPTALHERAGLFVDLGGLDGDERLVIRLGLRPARSIADHRVMRVRATLLADDAILPIGAAERRVSGRIDLGTSTLARLDERPLRLGMPVEARLEISNTGDSPARDVRLAIDLPPHIGASLPEAAAGSRWRPFVPSLPPGGAVATTVTFFLLEPPPSPHHDVPVYVDAAGQSAFCVARLRFATPSEPLIDPPRLQAHALDDGHIAFLARIANHGDGIARDVRVRVPDDTLVLLRTTAIDGTSVPDRGPRSPLGTGLALGDLAPGAYRDITWIVAALDETPYRTTVEVHSANGASIETRSIPTRARQPLTMESALPAARRLGEADVLAEGIRSVRIVAENDDPRLTGSEPAALTTSSRAIERYELPPPSAPPATIPPAATVPESPLDLELPAAPTHQPIPTAAIAPAETLPSVLPIVPMAGDVGADDQPPAIPPDADFLPDDDGPAGDAVPLLPNAAVSLEPLVLGGRVDGESTQLALRMAREMIAIPSLGMWRHIIFIRACLAEEAPLPNLAEPWRTLRQALVKPIMRVYPRLLNEDFVLGDAFVDALSEGDQPAIEALEMLARTERRLGIAFAHAQGSVRLDTSLPVLLPERFDAPAFATAFAGYRELAIRMFGYERILTMSESERRERYAQTNATLDAMLLESLNAS